MRRINVKSVKDGMVLAEPVVNARGSLLMDKGTALREAFIARLTQWGIPIVCVEGRPQEGESVSTVQESSEMQKIPLEKLFEGKIVNDSMQIIYDALTRHRNQNGG
jgi:molybdopterin biosynthesis enzyme